jgi:hypothetical protein
MMASRGTVGAGIAVGPAVADELHATPSARMDHPEITIHTFDSHLVLRNMSIISSIFKASMA